MADERNLEIWNFVLAEEIRIIEIRINLISLVNTGKETVEKHGNRVFQEDIDWRGF